MNHFYLLLLACISMIQPLKAANSSHLNYELNKPVSYVISAENYLIQKSPEKNKILKTQQNIFFTLSPSKYVHPNEYYFSLDRIQISLKDDKGIETFDTQAPISFQAEVEQLKNWIGVPIRLKFDSQQQLLMPLYDIEKLKERAPLGANLFDETSLTVFFKLLFLISKCEIQKSKTFNQPFYLGEPFQTNANLESEIKNCDSKEIKALHKGYFTSSTNAKNPLDISGRLEGKTIWSRESAFLINSSLTGSFSGNYHRNGKTIPIELHVNYEIKTLDK